MLSRERNENSHAERRAAIRRLIRTSVVGTQEELRQRLAREGYEVTQATLSRDLARLGARRVALPEGGTAYEVDEIRVTDGAEALGQFRGMITSVEDTDALVVVHTLPGAASAVALAVDRARLKHVSGSIAGDDTIFIAPSRGNTPAKVAKQLKNLWLKGGLQ